MHTGRTREEWQAVAKDVLDRAGAVVLLVVLLPVYAGIAAAAQGLTGALGET